MDGVVCYELCKFLGYDLYINFVSYIQETGRTERE